MSTYPPQVASVRQARRFVEAAVADSAVPALADDAALLASELAANAVLHARTDFTVTVDVIEGGVRVSVRDHSHVSPVVVAPSATAMSGRGLALVQTLASRWGAGASSRAVKSVWFELVTGQDPSDSLQQRGTASGGTDTGPSVEELLAAWSDSEDVSDVPWPTLPTAGPPGASPSQDPRSAPGGEDAGGRDDLDLAVDGSVQVVLPALDSADLMAAKEAMEDVLRELQLVLLSSSRDEPGQPHQFEPAAQGAPGPGVSERELAVARALDETARDFADVRAQVRHQVSRAVATGSEHVVLRLQLGPDAAERATAYAEAVQAAEQLAQTGTLLSVGSALQRHRAVRRAYLLEVIAAAAR